MPSEIGMGYRKVRETQSILLTTKFDANNNNTKRGKYSFTFRRSLVIFRVLPSLPDKCQLVHSLNKDLTNS